MEGLADPGNLDLPRRRVVASLVGGGVRKWERLVLFPPTTPAWCMPERQHITNADTRRGARCTCADEPAITTGFWDAP